MPENNPSIASRSRSRIPWRISAKVTGEKKIGVSASTTRIQSRISSGRRWRRTSIRTSESTNTPLTSRPVSGGHPSANGECTRWWQEDRFGLSRCRQRRATIPFVSTDSPDISREPRFEQVRRSCNATAAPESAGSSRGRLPSKAECASRCILYIVSCLPTRRWPIARRSFQFAGCDSGRGRPWSR